MRKITVSATVLLSLLIAIAGYSQDRANKNPDKVSNNNLKNKKNMKTYVIEREIPNAGNLTPDELKGISEKSNEVVAEMGPQIEWIHSYVTDNKVYCVYRAENEELIRKHAEKGGFPASSIQQVATTINPETGKEVVKSKKVKN
jgi:hypothetical protein